jgi:hypothetical protein
MTAEPEYVTSPLVAEGGGLVREMLDDHARHIVRDYSVHQLKRDHWIPRFDQLLPAVRALAEPYEVVALEEQLLRTQLYSHPTAAELKAIAQHKMNLNPRYELVQPDERYVIGQLLDLLDDMPAYLRGQLDYTTRVTAFTEHAIAFLGRKKRK